MDNIYNNDGESFRGQLLNQYDTETASIFYHCLMGGTGSSIHYGLYRDGCSVNEASVNTVHFMAKLLTGKGVHLDAANVLDLGAGTGFSAHILAKEFNSHVTCLNYSPRQNKENLEEATKLGLTHFIDVVEGDFENLPDSWENQFDIIWSEEAFCHSKNRDRLFHEVQKVLKDTGTLIFTDIMCGTAQQGEEGSINERNTVTQLITPDEYFKRLIEHGFTTIEYIDLSKHLSENYGIMAQNILDNKTSLMASGLQEGFLDDYIQSLKKSISDSTHGKVKWGCFLANKDHQT